jgi:hypothetical protein
MRLTYKAGSNHSGLVARPAAPLAYAGCTNPAALHCCWHCLIANLLLDCQMRVTHLAARRAGLPRLCRRQPYRPPHVRQRLAQLLLTVGQEATQGVHRGRVLGGGGNQGEQEDGRFSNSRLTNSRGAQETPYQVSQELLGGQ